MLSGAAASDKASGHGGNPAPDSPDAFEAFLADLPDIPAHVDRSKRKRDAVSPSYAALSTLHKPLNQLSNMHAARQISMDTFVCALKLYGMQASCAPTDQASMAGNECLTMHLQQDCACPKHGNM